MSVTIGHCSSSSSSHPAAPASPGPHLLHWKNLWEFIGNLWEFIEKSTCEPSITAVTDGFLLILMFVLANSATVGLEDAAGMAAIELEEEALSDSAAVRLGEEEEEEAASSCL